MGTYFRSKKKKRKGEFFKLAILLTSRVEHGGEAIQKMEGYEFYFGNGIHYNIQENNLDFK